MALIPPSDLVATAAGGYTVNLAWTNGEVYELVRILRKPAGGTYSIIKSITGTLEEYEDAAVPEQNVSYVYKVRGFAEGETSDDSNEDDAANWTTSNTDTCTVSDTHTVAVAFVQSQTETCTPVDSYSAEHSAGEPGLYEVEETDTVTCTDSYEISVISGQDYMYYLGSSAGEVYPYSGSYYGDDAADITSYWISKRTDFSDQHPQLRGQLVTVKGITLTYVDLDTAVVTLGVSTDGGATWKDVHKSIGTGNGKVKDAIYDFWKTGRFFSFRIKHTSHEKDFQWVRLTVDIEPQAEWRNVN